MCEVKRALNFRDYWSNKQKQLNFKCRLCYFDDESLKNYNLQSL